MSKAEEFSIDAVCPQFLQVQQQQKVVHVYGAMGKTQYVNLKEKPLMYSNITAASLVSVKVASVIVVT